MTRAQAVLFDLDGTLLDTAPDMIGALNRLLQEESREPLPFAAVRSSVSHGAVRLIKVGFPDAQGAEFERLRLRFLDVYAANLAGATRLFAGLEDVLATFEADGLPWGVVTNKPGWLTDPLLLQLGLAQRACCIVSGDTVAERKPHPLRCCMQPGLRAWPPTAASTSAMPSATSRPDARRACRPWWRRTATSAMTTSPNPGRQTASSRGRSTCWTG